MRVFRLTVPNTPLPLSHSLPRMLHATPPPPPRRKSRDKWTTSQGKEDRKLQRWVFSPTSQWALAPPWTVDFFGCKVFLWPRRRVSVASSQLTSPGLRAELWVEPLAAALGWARPESASRTRMDFEKQALSVSTIGNDLSPGVSCSGCLFGVRCRRKCVCVWAF